ncbi:hypothetical protein CBB2_2601 [Clostridium botulinum]|uniref:hypothetical protein n=1 Tax=Clostridium botulinum TaxID=1491 RepID=UPI0005822DFC|nr:hypothetical protein [Clostridium botulinum]BAQ14711.1 hypothetical protein CBB2_2601 [Clostridium botulinum]
MNKVEIKKLFWKLVDGIEYCCDTTVENSAGVVVERGMQLSNDYSIMFGLDDGVIRIYKEQSPLIAFTEESEILLILKELFESLEITKEAPEIPAQEQLKKDKNNELLALIITADSLISKVIKIIKNDISE